MRCGGAKIADTDPDHFRWRPLHPSAPDCEPIDSIPCAKWRCWGSETAILLRADTHGPKYRTLSIDYERVQAVTVAQKEWAKIGP